MHPTCLEPLQKATPAYLPTHSLYLHKSAEPEGGVPVVIGDMFMQEGGEGRGGGGHSGTVTAPQVTMVAREVQDLRTLGKLTGNE